MSAIKCPICGTMDIQDLVEMAVHLMDKHSWSYEKAGDWIVEQEELCRQ